MGMRDIIKRLQEERAQAWEEAKSLLDTAETEKRALTAEEETKWTAINADLDQKDARIKELLDVEQREVDADAARQRLAGMPPGGPVTGSLVPAGQTIDTQVRAFLKGETRDVLIRRDTPMTLVERRVLSKLSAGAGGNVVPTSFYDQLIAHLIEVSGIMQAGATVLTTDSGESLQVPKTTAHSTGALTAEAGTISASDPTFGQATLSAYKYAVLVQVSNELVTDTAVDLLGYLAMQCGRAVGNAAGVHFITGTGTAQPAGIVTGATLGVTGGAGVTGAFTGDNLIDLMFSVIAPYRNSPACAWLMKDATLGAVRKLKSTATGDYYWQPSLALGVPDTLMGKPVYTDPNIAAVALSAKSVLFGDMSQYLIREVAGVRFERSDDFAFNADLITFRCAWRADGVLVDQTGAVKFFAGNAA